MRPLPFSILIITLCLFRETSHQLSFLYPSIPLFLATEEFIESEPTATTTTPSPSAVIPIPEDGSNGQAENPLTNTKDPPPSQNIGGGTDNNDVKHHPEESNKSPQQAQEKQDDGQKIVENSPNPNISTITSTGDEKSTTGNGSQLETETAKKGEEEEPIPSYMEWAQKKQQELTKLNQHHANSAGTGGSGNNNLIGGNGAGSNGQGGQGAGAAGAGARNGSAASARDRDSVDAKNFASPDCGAKVVQSNSEAQNPSGVLSSSHDEYMLNKCGTSIWFVVELCEPLTIDRISLGNLELFSSSPKDVELGISDRYPTRDWVKLGPFTLPDARAVHPILLPPSNSSTFGKFVKVSVLSHHGSEHYCPVSIIKINGKSEYEVLESETTHQEDQNKEDSALYEEQLEDQPREVETQTAKSSGIKDTVLNLLNKAVQSIVRRGYPPQTTERGEDYQSLQSNCKSVLQCVSKTSDGSQDLQEIYKLLSCNSSNILPFLQANSPWCGWDYCHTLFGRQSIGLPWQPEGFYAALFGGPSVLHALCHFNKPLKVDGCDATAFTWINGHNVSLGSQDSGKNGNIVNGDGHINESTLGTDTVESVIDKIPVSPDKEGQLPVVPEQTDEQKSSQQQPPSDQQDVSGGNSQPVTETPVDIPSDSLSAPPTQSNGVHAPPANSVPASPQQQQGSAQETQIPSPTGGGTDSDSSGGGHHQFQPISGSPPGQKESVFVRLTNRIKSLERNQSLTASYLEELSRRFKKQNEDNSILAENSKKLLNETRVKVLHLDDYYRTEVQSIRRNLDDVRERLFTVQLQRSLLVIICFIQSLFLIFGFIWVKRRFAQIEVKIQQSSNSSNQVPDEVKVKPVIKKEVIINDDDFERFDIGLKPLIMRKRSNSDVTSNEKARKVKKRNRKQNANGGTSSGAIVVDKFDIPKSQSGDGYFDVPFNTNTSKVLKHKENIDPSLAKLPPKSPLNSTLSSSNNSNSLRPSSLLTKVDDSPFTFVSQIPTSSSSSSPGISTSGRFALLASPASPDSPISFKSETLFPSNLLSSSNDPNTTQAGAIKSRSGSGASTASTMSSQSLSGIVMNGHAKLKQLGSADSGNVKKGKKGLKSFMPKIFDR